MSRCKKDTKTNCFKIISSHFFKKKRNVPSMPERKTCSNEKTFVEPTQFSANKTESMTRNHKVEKTLHNCSVKQLRPRFHSHTVKCRKHKRTSNNTVLSLILRKLHYWCPCFCCCKTKSRRVLSPNTRVNSCPCDEKLLNQLCITCSDKGLKMSTENLKTTRNTRQKLNNKSKKTKASSLQQKQERKKEQCNCEMAKDELIAPKIQTKCKNDRTAVNRFAKEEEEIHFESVKCRHNSRKSYETAKKKTCECRANHKQHSNRRPLKPKPEKGFVFRRKHDHM